MCGFAERGVKAPRDESIVGFDDLPIATRLLLDIIDGKTTPSQRIILPSELIIHDSCGMLQAER